MDEELIPRDEWEHHFIKYVLAMWPVEYPGQRIPNLEVLLHIDGVVMYNVPRCTFRTAREVASLHVRGMGYHFYQKEPEQQVLPVTAEEPKESRFPVVEFVQKAAGWTAPYLFESSSFIEWGQYHQESCTLRLCLRGETGYKVFEYGSITPTMWRDMTASRSAGAFYNAMIKGRPVKTLTYPRWKPR